MKYNSYFLFFIVLLFVGCSTDVDKFTKVNENDTAPSVITNYEVENLPGAVIVTYDIPKGEDLLYVMAEYQLHNKTIQSKASYYDNHIKLEGFGESKEYPVKLYSVSRGGKQSKPLDITINPLTPQVDITFESFAISPTFGGFKIGFENFSESELKIFVLTADSVGDLYNPETFYTKRREATFAVRGFKDEERTFGVFVMDRWNNRSDTIFTTLTPLYEEKIDKKTWKFLQLPTDNIEMHGFRTAKSLFDDSWDAADCFHTKPNSGMPQWFTLDLGVSAQFSRFKLHSQAGRANPSWVGDPKNFEIYGSNDPPNKDGSWDSWILLGAFQSTKKEASLEDYEFACVRGEDYEFESEEVVRYIRFKTLETWGGVTYIYIAELTFYGQIME